MSPISHQRPNPRGNGIFFFLSSFVMYFLTRKSAGTPTRDLEFGREFPFPTMHAGDADRCGTWPLGVRPGNGVSALFLSCSCERGSHRHTAVVTRPRLRLALLSLTTVATTAVCPLDVGSELWLLTAHHGSGASNRGERRCFGANAARACVCEWRRQIDTRAGLETFGLVHEHKSVTFFTSHVRCQNAPKKRAPMINMVAPITISTTPADPAGGGKICICIAALSTRTTTAEVSAGHRFPHSL